MHLDIAYYTEVNLTCITLLMLFKSQLRRRNPQFSSSQLVTYQLMGTIALMCVFDMIATTVAGQTFCGAWMIVQLSNMLFYFMVSLTGYLWLIFVYRRLGIIADDNRVTRLIQAVPLIAVSLVILTNPLTHLLFTVDMQAIYVRGDYVWLHWLVTWGYTIAATVRTLSRILHEKNKFKRQEIWPLVGFIVPPIISAVIQMVLPGISVMQVGMTIGVAIVTLLDQNNQISTDELTGLNNRRAFALYIENHIVNHPDDEVTVFMLDMNNFKRINDMLGHTYGDHVLSEAADALRQVCMRVPTKLFLCRYGGDEFVMMGNVLSTERIEEIEQMIDEQLAVKNQKQKERLYWLEVSIGTASGICRTPEELEQLMAQADEVMYQKKKQRKKSAERCA